MEFYQLYFIVAMTFTNLCRSPLASARTGLINGMIRSCRQNQGYMLMVLDAFTVRILNSCAKVSDCVEAGVTVLLQLQAVRNEVPQCCCVWAKLSQHMAKSC
jgi:hypothetical protein